MIFIVPDGKPPKQYASHPVVKACEECYDDYLDNCSGFVKAVLKKLGLSPVANLFPNLGQANDIVEAFKMAPWTKIASSVLAAKMSEDHGRVVLAGCKDAPNGHVVVIVPGGLTGGKYPTAYWGSKDNPDKSAKYQTINWAWTGDDIDDVTYAYVTRWHGASGSW
ncbi:hypothetical protein [Paraburkholderia solitsugae]|uniref:hypothetical protein n=1 Tax=Paraburkholderia solitsugae TaxID=2675748 RepID=UPI001C12DCB8|nr:hypothetical protein [Paraburkholderia solitsugae]